jgi:hypothetical protein
MLTEPLVTALADEKPEATTAKAQLVMTAAKRERTLISP